jgi:putative transposase
MNTALYENQVLQEVDGRTLRVLWLPPSGEICLIDMALNGGMPFWTARKDILNRIHDESLELLVDDPSALAMRADSGLSPAELRARDKWHSYLLPLIEDPDRTVLYPEVRAQVIADHLREHGGTKRLIYDYLKRWWKRGQTPNTLVPEWAKGATRRGGQKDGEKKRGRPRCEVERETHPGVAVTREIAAKLRYGLRYLKAGRSVRKAYEDTLRAQFSVQIVEDGIRKNVVAPEAELPSFDQFYYHVVTKQKRGDVLLAVKGSTAFARKHRARLGSARDDTTGPGSHYQIDSTIADIYLRSHDNPDRLIGRPVLYLVVDVYSRMIVGFSVALSGPSWETGKLALENAMLDKVEYCRSVGMTITDRQWPARHEPRRLTNDRGKDVAGSNALAAAKALGYQHVRLPPYRPDWKGLVESRFEFIHDQEIRWLPGASHGRERGEPKHQLDGLYTVATFTEFMVECILHYNARFEVNKPPSGYVSPDGSAPAPLDLWAFGCTACAAPQLADPHRVRAALLHVGRGRETSGGLFFSGLHYQSVKAGDNSQFLRIPGRKWAVYEVRYDPRDMSRILVESGRTQKPEWFVLTPADRQFAGWTLDEIKDDRAMRRVGRRRKADTRRGMDSSHEAKLADIERKAFEKSVQLRTGSCAEMVPGQPCQRRPPWTPWQQLMDRECL